MVTKDGGASITFEGKLMDVGNDEDHRVFIVVQPVNSKFIRIPVSEAAARELAPMLYQDVTVTMNIVPKGEQ